MGRFLPLEVTEAQVMDALKEAQGNQRRAAESLGVTQGWVAKWLKRNGYVQHVTWVKSDTPA